MIRKYEIMYIIDQDTKEVKDVQKKLNDILTSNGGKIVASEDWGIKEFAYEINHKKKGFYSIVIVETESANINEFQRVAGIDKNVVRTLVINTETEKKYVESTKMSKTDMSKFKEEKRPQRGFDKKRTFEKRDDAPKSADANATTEKAAPKDDAKTDAPKTTKKDAE